MERRNGLRAWALWGASCGAIWAAAAGCGGPAAPSASGPGGAAPKNVESSRVTAAAGAESESAASPAADATGAAGGGESQMAAPVVVVIDTQGYETVLQRQQGKVVLVDFWATWCGPCKEQFPHTAELATKLADRGLRVMSVSFDDSDNEAAVVEFLKQHPAPMAHLLSSYGAGVESFDNFGIEGGAVPFYKLYDRKGKLRYQFTGNPEGLKDVLDPKEIDARIAELLDEKA